jgi:CheY-like chemotaxis protein
MRKSVKVLQAEDEAITAMQMDRELRSLGYDVVPHVATGEAAVKSAMLNKPDVIIMDIRLAGAMDGIEAAAAIQAEADIPVIFLTGYDDSATRDRALKLNPLAFLIKPDVMQSLKAVLGSFAATNDI